MSLSPWDLGGNITFDFTIYRPRRPSYVFATQMTRQRSESYRHATTSEVVQTNNDAQAMVAAAIDSIRRKRKDSYRAATQEDDEEHPAIEDTVAPVGNHVGGGGTAMSSPATVVREALMVCTCPSPETWKAVGNNVVEGQSRKSSVQAPLSQSSETVFAAGRGDSTEDEARHRRAGHSTMSRCRYTKNLVVLSLSFILVFTAFRSIQNIQSSLNSPGRLGAIAMGCVHGTMFLTCLFTPVLINKLTSKWTIVLGLLFYLFWIAANFCPHLFTLIPTSIGVGFGQSLSWGAQVTYIQKLVDDYVHTSGEMTQQELYRFNGIFLACFQTSHIWGNLVSSLLLTAERLPNTDKTEAFMGIYCGVYDICDEPVAYITGYNDTTVSSASSTVLKLMGSYLVFAFIGFLLILIFLEKIGSKEEPEQPCLQVAWKNFQLLSRHKVYRLLVPLLIFNGFEQGFVYSDFTKSYISCTLGIEFIGYNMITLGMSNSVSSVLVGHVARHVAREAIVGIGTILHLGLMVFLLVWIPDHNLLPVFFVISALWGVCDAIWQTQCNCLVSLSCSAEYDVAFQNFRMLQGLGASLAFFFSTFMCVYVKLCTLIALLVLSVVFYIIAEYQIRKLDVTELPTVVAR